MNHFHLSIKFNMGEVLYSLIIAVVVGLLYFTSIDGHVFRCKYFFYIFFLDLYIESKYCYIQWIVLRWSSSENSGYRTCTSTYVLWNHFLFVGVNGRGLPKLSWFVGFLSPEVVLHKAYLRLSQHRHKYSF